MSDLYRELLLERLENPINQGVIDKPDLEARLVNPLCGDEVTIELKVKNNIVEQAVYSGNGCAISQVSASFLAENIEGKTLEKIKKIKNNDILKLMGINPSPSREKCATLSLEVLQKALNERI
ncbi:MAG TPA: iron-sulfur cluster assembly scaffold protein [Candidatus Saccharimonadales bacterium]|nr:iron-sulfur cluster assembly scaffold protein [Candidatus Saccharimonadales bacterium]